jgi:hypothetical protein
LIDDNQLSHTAHLLEILFRLNGFVLAATNWRWRANDSSLIASHLTLSQQLSTFRFFFLANVIAFSL